MELLSEFHAERICGGRRGAAMARTHVPMASLLLGLLGLTAGASLGRGAMGLSGIGSIATNVNQLNLAFNIVLNGGSIVNNQLNGLDLSVGA